MNIQGLGQSMPVQGASKQGDPRLKSLDQQINDLQKRIREVRKNEKLDPKSKQEKIREYEQQIQLLQQEKARIQAEESRGKNKTEENGRHPENREAKAESAAVDSKVQNAFVKMDSFKTTEKATGVVRAQTEGELRIAESKSYLRDPNPEAASKARAKLNTIDRTTLNNAKEIAEEFNETAKEPVSASKESSEEESDRERVKRGTGRMEPGQFLDDEA